MFAILFLLYTSYVTLKLLMNTFMDYVRIENENKMKSSSDSEAESEASEDEEDSEVVDNNIDNVSSSDDENDDENEEESDENDDETQLEEKNEEDIDLDKELIDQIREHKYDDDRGVYKRQFDFDEEPGRDYKIDEHGNIVYGCGYVGAPILPRRNLGICPKEFCKEYVFIKKTNRFKIFTKVLKNTSCEYIKELIDLLIDYEKTTPDFDKPESLISILERHVKTQLDKAFPRSYYTYCQYKYLKQLSEIMSLESKRAMFNDVLKQIKEVNDFCSEFQML